MKINKSEKLQTAVKKQIVPISINKITYKINLFHVEVVSLIHFNSSFLNSSKDLQSKVKAYIRNLVKDKEEISAQIIEVSIFLDNLPKKIQKELNNLTHFKVNDSIIKE